MPNDIDRNMTREKYERIEAEIARVLATNQQNIEERAANENPLELEDPTAEDEDRRAQALQDAQDTLREEARKNMREVAFKRYGGHDQAFSRVMNDDFTRASNPPPPPPSVDSVEPTPPNPPNTPKAAATHDDRLLSEDERSAQDQPTKDSRLTAEFNAASGGEKNTEAEKAEWRGPVSPEGTTRRRVRTIDGPEL